MQILMVIILMVTERIEMQATGVRRGVGELEKLRQGQQKGIYNISPHPSC
jgi:hypothetical protein